MTQALAVCFLGVGMAALGLLDGDMYVVGGIVLFVGVVGVLVRAGYRLQEGRRR